MRTIAVERLLDHLNVIRVAAQRQIAAFRTVMREQRPRSVIGKQNHALAGKQYQTFIHAGRNVVKLSLTALQLVHLRLNFAVLLVHAVQQRRQLVIGFALHRIMQVERFDRLEEQTGQPACQQRRDQQRQQDDQHNPRRRIRQCAEHAVRSCGNTQNIAVFQAHRVIKRLLSEGFRQTVVLARAVLLCRRNLRTDGVVLHLGGIHAVVVQHRAVLRDQRQTVGIYRAEFLQLLPDVIHRRQVAALRHQPLPHVIGQTGVNCQQQQPGRQQQRDKRCEKNAAEYALSHVCSPMR